MYYDGRSVFAVGPSSGQGRRTFNLPSSAQQVGITLRGNDDNNTRWWYTISCETTYLADNLICTENTSVSSNRNFSSHKLQDQVSKNDASAIISIRENIVRIARTYIDSTNWAYAAATDRYPANTHKCNLFVYDVLTEAGLRPPSELDWSTIHLPYPAFWNPYRAGQWADPTVVIPGWEVVDSAQPGDIIAIKKNYSDATGHVGIVSRDRMTISVVDSVVKENNWGFRPGQVPTIRRYVGTW